MFIFLQDLPVYSSEGKVMMAEIPRDDQLKERRREGQNYGVQLLTICLYSSRTCQSTLVRGRS